MAGSPSLQASEKGQAGCVHLDTIEQHLVSLTGLDRHGVSPSAISLASASA